MSDNRDDIVKLIKDAVLIVDAAKVPQDLRASAFRIAAQRLDASDRPSPQTTPAEAPKDAARLKPNTANPNEAIAGKLGLKGDQVARVFDVDGEGIHLHVSRAALGKSKRTAMREVVQLVVAARQALGEEWTPINELRQVAEDRGVLDPPNWSLAAKSLDGKGFRFKGPSTAREIKINQVGYEAAAAIVERLASGG